MDITISVTDEDVAICEAMSGEDFTEMVQKRINQKVTHHKDQADHRLFTKVKNRVPLQSSERTAIQSALDDTPVEGA